MKRFTLSAFLTITALSVAGLVSHSAAQQGPSATPPPASPAPGPSTTQPPAPSAQGSCQQIMAACQQAGFLRGGAKTGAGLQVDCVRPIMQGGTFQRPKASKALPQVDQQIVAACKASNPNFGNASAQRAGKAQQTAPQ